MAQKISGRAGRAPCQTPPPVEGGHFSVHSTLHDASNLAPSVPPFTKSKIRGLYATEQGNGASTSSPHRPGKRAGYCDECVCLSVCLSVTTVNTPVCDHTSNLPFLSKLLERVVQRRLQEFLDRNDMMPLTQSAYRQFHSQWRRWGTSAWHVPPYLGQGGS